MTAAITVVQLLPRHFAELSVGSGISAEMLARAGIYSETNRDKLKILLKRTSGMSKAAPAYVIPYYGLDGNNGYCRVKRDEPRIHKGETIKYEAPIGEKNRGYFPPGVVEMLPNQQQELIITEGEKKALKATDEGFPAASIPGVWAWKEKDQERLIPDLEKIPVAGRKIFIAFDSDLERKSLEDAEARFAAQLTSRGAIVRCVRIPDGPPDSENGEPTKWGLDDFLVHHGPNAKRELRKLLDDAVEPAPVKPDETREDASKLEPSDEAEAFLETGKQDGVHRLRFYRGGFHLWAKGRYTELSPGEVRCKVVTHINQNYCYLNTGIVGNFIDQLKAQSLLSFGHDAPCWLDLVPGCEDWQPTDLLTLRNSIIHLPSLIAGRPYSEPATPRLFTPAALDFDFIERPPAPSIWLGLLNQYWENDEESINALQEWFGYCLTANTRQQKILLLIGPTRSGKGTIGRILRSLVGSANVIGPTLASMGQTFGLQPFLGKTLAIVSDARLGRQSDVATITERLLSISGEDTLTVDRKYQESVTGKLLTRLMILSNEFPKLTDSSGALVGRFLILRMIKKFYDQEDTTLTDKLLRERPGILWWAIKGWERLNKNGRFTQPESSKEAREQLEDIASPVGQFVRERCLIGPVHEIEKSSLYSAWCDWCKSKGRDEPGIDSTFGRDLLAAVSTVQPASRGDGKDRRKVYVGIKLT